MSHPEWAAVGSTVAIKSLRSIDLAVVTRHTTTQIIIGSRRFRGNAVYREMGAGDAWHPAPRLLPADDPEVSRFLHEREAGRLVWALRKAADAISVPPLASQVASARECLEALERILEEKS